MISFFFWVAVHDGISLADWRALVVAYEFPVSKAEKADGGEICLLMWYKLPITNCF